MLNFWLPETARDEWDPFQEAEQATMHSGVFHQLLQQIDVRLELRWIKDGAASFPESAHNRWVIVRLNEGAPPMFWVVQNPDGSYTEPDERHLQALMSLDESAHPGVYQRYRKKREREQLDKRYRKEQKRQEFREALLDRFNHILDARIAVTAAHKEKLDRGKDQGAAAPAAAR